jgi:hypothetical protein
MSSLKCAAAAFIDGKKYRMRYISFKGCVRLCYCLVIVQKNTVLSSNKELSTSKNNSWQSVVFLEIRINRKLFAV